MKQIIDSMPASDILVLTLLALLCVSNFGVFLHQYRLEKAKKGLAASLDKTIQ